MPFMLSLPSWLRRGSRRSPGTKAVRTLLFLEPLEERNLLAATVTGAATGSGGSLAFQNVLAGSWSAGYNWVDVQVADLTGNGLDDVVGRIQQNGQWYAAMSNGAGGYTNIALTAWAPQMTWLDVKVADLNGDGRDAIIGMAQQSGQWWALAYNGTGYTNQLLTTWSPNVTWINVNVADLNGDGKADIVGMVQQTGQWWASVSGGATFTTTLWDRWNPSVTWVDVQAGDLTGNGRDDIVGRDLQTGQWYAGISSGASFATSLWTTWSTAVTWENVQLADMNGDGKADLVGRVLQSGQWWVGESTGTSFTNSLWATWSPSATWVDVQVADFTGSGRMDIAGMALQSGQWWVGVSNGTSFNTTLWTTWAPNVTWEDVQAANVDSNSTADLVGMVAGSGQWWVALSQAPAKPNTGVIGDMWLNDVAQTAAESGDAGAAATYGNHIEFNVQDQVGLNVQVTLPQFVNSVKGNLIAMGMAVTAVDPTTAVITGYLSPSKISSLHTLLHFSTATVNDVPMVDAGAVPSEGNPIILANNFVSATGDDGTGQTIGLISNSANQYTEGGQTLGGLAASYAVGALIPSEVNDLNDPPVPGSDDEGRAMMELAHDVAPGANLDFYSENSPAGLGSAATAANAVLSLAAAGANQIADDVYFIDEPIFNDGLMSQAIDQVASQGVVYSTSAGNKGNMAFTAPWTSIQGTVGAGPTSVSGTFFDFGFGGSNILQDFTLPFGAAVEFDLQWDNAFLEGGTSVLPNYQVPTYLNAYITDPTGTIIEPLGTFNSTGTNEAVQDCYWQNFTGATNFALAIQLASGPAPTHIEWINQQNFPDPMAQGEGSATIFGHAEATGAITVGAISGASPYTSPVVEPFSALGGNLPIYFDANGNRLAIPDIRQKPDLVAPDNIDVSFDIGGGAIDNDTPADGWPNFQGTSASTEQIAAAAALLREESPTITNTQIEAHLKATTLVFGTAPFDPSSGAGLLQITPVAPTTTVQFTTAGEAVSEAVGSFSIPVTLSAASAQNVTVPFTISGTAVAGVDYTLATASPLVISAGQTSATITGTLIDDPGVNKTLTFTLGAPTLATLGSITVNTLTILQPVLGSPPPPPPPPPQIAGPPDDQFELNDTSNTATNFGVLAGTLAYTGLTINEHYVNGIPMFDQDWYTMTAAAGGTFTSTLSGIQANGGDIQERVFEQLPSGSLQLVGSSTLTGGVSTQTVSVPVTAGEQLYVWVYGYNFALGYYNLTVTLQ